MTRDDMPVSELGPRDWMRHCFHANEDDPRPVTFPPPGPWWCSGFGNGYSTVVAYLPDGVDVTQFWPDATHVDSERRDALEFSDRFPKPDWWTA